MAVASWSPLVRSRKNESISSMKTMQGWVFRARLNRPATSLFDSPNHLFVREEIATLMKVAPDSLATAFASIVLPHPGGPKRRTPLGAPARMEELLKRLGYMRGYIIVSRSEEMIWSKPPISVLCVRRKRITRQKTCLKTSHGCHLGAQSRRRWWLFRRE